MPYSDEQPARRSRRVAWKIEQWPAADRLAWTRAERRGGFKDDDGKAVRWRPATRKAAIGAYGRFLAHLDDSGRLDLGGEPAECVTLDTVGDYVSHLRLTVSSTTAASYLAVLELMAQAMAPAQDWGWLARMRTREQRRAEPIRNKQSKVVSQHDLLALGRDLMDLAEAVVAKTPLKAAL